MQKPPLRLGFTDTFGTAINFFTDVLGQRYQVIRDDANPDYLIFGDSNFGNNHYNYTGRCKKIFYTGENVRPTYFTYDHAITFDHEMSPRHYRLPLYVLEMKMMTYEKVTDDFLWLTNERSKIDWEREWNDKIDICSYLQGNPNCQVRTQFVSWLLQRKNVRCGGTHFNNIGRVIPRNIHSTLQFLEACKFNIAFENGSYPGYTTEKLLNAFYARTLPIYWGNPRIELDFNPKAFINCNDLSFQEIVDRIDELNSDKKKYLDMISQPVFVENIPNKYINIYAFLDWWETFVYE